MNIVAGTSITNKYWFSRNSVVINVSTSVSPGRTKLELSWKKYSLTDGTESAVESTVLYIQPVRLSINSYILRVDLTNLFNTEKNCFIQITNSTFTAHNTGVFTPYSLFDSASCFILSGGKSKSDNTDGITYQPFIGIILSDKTYVGSTSDKVYVIHSSAANSYIYANKDANTYSGTVLFTAGSFKVSYVTPAVLGTDVAVKYVYSGGNPSTLRTFGLIQPPPLYENQTPITYLNSYGIYEVMTFYTEKRDVHEITPSEQQAQSREDGQRVFSVKRGTIRRKHSLSSGYLNNSQYACLLDLLMSEETTVNNIPVQVTCSGIDRNSAGREPFSTELTIETLYDDVK